MYISDIRVAVIYIIPPYIKFPPGDILHIFKVINFILLYLKRYSYGRII